MAKRALTNGLRHRVKRLVLVAVERYGGPKGMILMFK